ncbi:PLC-like phosphodiesterase, TIM beta/alpha-barrel domain protein [Metarhizium album ARSEF 1941]|uniref:Altered inheritance of mitochondria protein 6 n=1 Tax=Metarhizium album (strain ARSEF 1941) TaxID=1081103 RepID=A0A0B2WSW2_METAS|nr:PLC-like phosphodiesterase, TIM beta/alpha-barrel domain protein [Metarhizium album ARSEF 1941]KHN97123.1 PLC-like phosphodiesterase, TIM beta/alpha-barrel domain protein [Metarhizium album ARSEF 1941]
MVASPTGPEKTIISQDDGSRHGQMRRPRPRHSDPTKYEILCARSLLLWLIASGGTGLTIGIILVITWAAQPKAMRSTQSHNFISINPADAAGPSPETYLNDHAKSVIPVPVHSHNDYWRPRPLYSALAAGCMSVEADVWLSPDGNDLYVGHQPSALSPDRTLQTLYLDPIKQILDGLNPGNGSHLDGGPNGMFQTSPDTTLVLLIDVKGNATHIWPLVDQQLQPLRKSGYLSTLEYGNSTSDPASQPVFKQGPITIVASGNIGKSNVTGVGCDALKRYGDTFLDAPIDALADESNYGKLADCRVDSLLGRPLAKFYMASAPLMHTVRPATSGGLSSGRKDDIRAALQAAAARNLTSRYWSLPSWPISRRDHIWQFLVDEGIGLLNADDIESAARLEWNRAYKAELVWIGLSSAYIFFASLLFAYLLATRRQTLDTGGRQWAEHEQQRRFDSIRFVSCRVRVGDGPYLARVKNSFFPARARGCLGLLRRKHYRAPRHAPGLWANNCNGQYPAQCDSGRVYTDIGSMLDGSGAGDTLAHMRQHWKDHKGDDESLRKREWARTTPASARSTPSASTPTRADAYCSGTNIEKQKRTSFVWTGLLAGIGS